MNGSAAAPPARNQISTGIRGVLSHPAIYELWSKLVGGERCRTTIVTEYVRPAAGDDILDLGCGTGEFFSYLPDEAHYLGIDISPPYIARARKRYGTRAEFQVADASQIALEGRRFDLVLAIALLHHLDDEQVITLLRDAFVLLKPSGRFVAFEPVRVTGQNPIARVMIDNDRGQHARDLDSWERLARTSFASVHSVIRQDLLRIPYTHLILECVRDAPPA